MLRNLLLTVSAIVTVAADAAPAPAPAPAPATALGQVPCPIIIDVRDKADTGVNPHKKKGWDSGHISCAISVPKAEFTAWLEKNKDSYESNQPFYTYCYSGDLSGKAKDEMVTAGFANAKNGGSYFWHEDEKVLNEICDIQKTCLASTTKTTDMAALPGNASGSSSLQSPVVLSLALAVVGFASLLI